MNQITDQLWIGDIQDARAKPLGEVGIESVVTICEESVEEHIADACDYAHYNIQDGWPPGRSPGPGEYRVFASAVDRTRQAIDAGKTVFVHCHAGMSRSVSVVACVLACDHDYSLDDAYWHVRTHRETNVHDDLRLLASRYVNRHRG